MNSKIKVLDLFAGVGGLSFAFHRSKDFEVVAANEILQAPARTYELNHRGVRVFQQDVRTFSKKLLADRSGEESTKIDLILGGPPCQTYSTAGKRSLLDPRAGLYNEYYRLLLEFKPRAFVFENVKGLLSMQGGALFEEIVELFSSAGYEVEAKLLSAVDFGAPQIRERVIVVGRERGMKFEYPDPTHGAGKNKNGKNLLRPLTLRDTVSDLPKVRPGESARSYQTDPQNGYQSWLRAKGRKELLDHDSPVYGDRLRRIMELVPEGGSGYDLPKHIRPTSGFGNSYGRLWWDKPTPTITRNLGTPSSARCIHPSLPRALTTREGARLQSFPDDFLFYGSRIQKNLQIGEAVPPLLSLALIESIRKSFSVTRSKKPRAVVRNKTPELTQ